MLLSTVVMLALAAWAPVLLAWITLACWSRAAPARAGQAIPPPTVRRCHEPPPGLPYASTFTVQCMLDTADEHGALQLSALGRSCAATERYHRRAAFEIATLVAILAVRDWADRAALERVNPYAAPAIEATRRSGHEALLSLFDRPFVHAYSRGELALRCRRLRGCLAQMKTGLRVYRQACRRATTAHPYR